MRGCHGEGLLRGMPEGAGQDMDKAEPSNRPKSKRVLSARAARQRHRESDASAVTPRQREFQLACAAWSERLSVKLNAFFNLMPQYGRTVHWARERYYGGTYVTDSDLYWMNSKMRENQSPSMEKSLRVYAAAVDLMCKVCAGDEDLVPTCWDGTCPLRAVSPLPLKDRR